MHPFWRAVLRPSRKSRKWILKQARWFRILINEKITPLLHRKSIQCYLFVDETGSPPGSNPTFFVGASGIVIPRTAINEFEECCLRFRDALSVYGADKTMEIHAVDWVHQKKGFPAITHIDARVHLLRRFLATCATCSKISVINVIADSGSPRIVASTTSPTTTQLANQMRRDVFRRLLLEFELELQRRKLKGHALVDDYGIGAVREIHLANRNQFNMQPLAPIGVLSHEHHGVQLADVCAYFMLQQFQPNASIDPRHTTDGLNEIAPLCQDSMNPGVAYVHIV